MSLRRGELREEGSVSQKLSKLVVNDVSADKIPAHVWFVTCRTQNPVIIFIEIPKGVISDLTSRAGTSGIPHCLKNCEGCWRCDKRYIFLQKADIPAVVEVGVAEQDCLYIQFGGIQTNQRLKG